MRKLRHKARWNNELALFIGQEHTLSQIIHNARYFAMVGDVLASIEPCDMLIIWDDAEEQWVYEAEWFHYIQNGLSPERMERRTVWYRVGTDGRLYGP